MKKRYSMISVMICGLISSSFSTANTLSFKGKVVEQTCKVNHYGPQPTITCLYGGASDKKKIIIKRQTLILTEKSVYIRCKNLFCK